MSRVKSINIHDGIDSTLWLLKTAVSKPKLNSSTKIVRLMVLFPTSGVLSGPLNQVFYEHITYLTP